MENVFGLLYYFKYPKMNVMKVNFTTTFHNLG